MTRLFEPIETSVGIIQGRDGFFLDQIYFEYDRRAVRFVGEINGNLCSRNVSKRDWIEYSLQCLGVLDFRMTELDFFDTYDNHSLKEGYLSSPEIGDLVSSIIENQTSFVRVVDSERLARMRELEAASKITPEHQHYIFTTYDYIFDIICSKYELTIK